jgi:hypothetical protein
MSRPTVRASDLPPDVLKQLGIKLPRTNSFTKESVRSWSLKTLALLAELKPRSTATSAGARHQAELRLDCRNHPVS